MLMTDDQKDKTVNKKDTNPKQDETGSVGMARPEMIDMARRFMMMPKVRQTSLIQQRRFLLEKGLRDDEINEAMKGLSSQHDMWNVNNAAMGHAVTNNPSYAYSKNTSTISVLLGLTKYAMIITGFSYASWRLLRSYILPRFFNVPEPVERRIYVIEEKMNDLQGMMHDVTTELLLKLQLLIDKQNMTDRSSLQRDTSLSQLDDIRRGIENISAMLVSKERLPPIRTLGNRNSITSHMLPRTEDCNEFDNPNKKRLGEISVSSEALSAQEKHGGIDGIVGVEKIDSGSGS